MQLVTCSMHKAWSYLRIAGAWHIHSSRPCAVPGRFCGLRQVGYAYVLSIRQLGLPASPLLVVDHRQRDGGHDAKERDVRERDEQVGVWVILQSLGRTARAEHKAVCSARALRPAGSLEAGVTDSSRTSHGAHGWARVSGA